MKDERGLSKDTLQNSPDAQRLMAGEQKLKVEEFENTEFETMPALIVGLEGLKAAGINRIPSKSTDGGFVELGDQIAIIREKLENLAALRTSNDKKQLRSNLLPVIIGDGITRTWGVRNKLLKIAAEMRAELLNA